MNFSYIWTSIILLLLSIKGYSAPTTTISVSVDIPEEPCVINGNQDIPVDFGRINPGIINGINYLQEIKYTVSCPVGILKPLRIKLISTQVQQNTDSLKTSIDGLSIKLLLNKNPVELNRDYSFKFGDRLDAIPIKTISNINTGLFTSSVIMQVSYD